MKKALLTFALAALTATAARADEFFVEPHSEVVARGYVSCVNQFWFGTMYSGSNDWYLRNPFPMTLIFTCEKAPEITR
jgi:uncharacterized GH25 family protein